MSSVRMCDNCGKVFSENEEGWTTFTGSKMKRDRYGDRYTETVQKDACADCSKSTFNQAQAIEAGEESAVND